MYVNLCHKTCYIDIYNQAMASISIWSVQGTLRESLINFLKNLVETHKGLALENKYTQLKNFLSQTN